MKRKNTLLKRNRYKKERENMWLYKICYRKKYLIMRKGKVFEKKKILSRKVKHISLSLSLSFILFLRIFTFFLFSFFHFLSFSTYIYLSIWRFLWTLCSCLLASYIVVQNWAEVLIQLMMIISFSISFSSLILNNNISLNFALLYGCYVYAMFTCKLCSSWTGVLIQLLHWPGT